MGRKIAFILGSMGRGGAERVISIISRDYAERGWDTDICLLLKNEVCYNLADTTRILDLSGKGESRLRRAPYWLSSIRRYVKEEKPDVVVSFAARINVIVMLACLGTKTKIVLSERNDPKCDGRDPVTILLTRLLYPHSEGIVFQTARAKSCFGRKIQKKGVIIPNPIEVQVCAKDTDIHKIVNVGSLKPQKNHELLINAFSDLSDKYPHMQLYIYGEGQLRTRLEEHIKRLGMQDKIHLPGACSDVHDQIKNAAMFVLSSDYEGLSNALLEAMMMGLPCISTNCSSLPEIIDNFKQIMDAIYPDGWRSWQ